jgi:hypothetical protein
MRTLILMVMCFFCVNAQSFMPKKLVLDSIVADLPKTPEETIDTSLNKTDFKQFALDSGKICPRNGILISTKKGAEYVFYKLGYDRQQRELKIANYLMNTYYDQSLAAEDIYKKQIVILQKEAKRNWFEKNNIYIGFVCGIAITILTEYAVIQSSK